MLSLSVTSQAVTSEKSFLPSICASSCNTRTLSLIDRALAQLKGGQTQRTARPRELPRAGEPEVDEAPWGLCSVWLWAAGVQGDFPTERWSQPDLARSSRFDEHAHGPSSPSEPPGAIAVSQCCIWHCAVPRPRCGSCSGPLALLAGLFLCHP